jgi:hypothetical protein
LVQTQKIEKTKIQRKAHDLKNQAVKLGPKTKKWQIKAESTWDYFRGKSIGSDPKKELII